MKRFVLILTVFFFAKAIAHSQYSLTSTSYSQDFNGLGAATLTNVTDGSLNNINSTLNGWFFKETGSAADIQFRSGTGSATFGDTYNFGLLADPNRKLGGLYSGSLNPTFGFYFINNTSIVITDLAISYTGETWRVGTASRSDRLKFQYSTNADSLNNGSWTDFDLLDYANPGQSTGSGNIQHTSAITATISSLNIAIGATFFIRWIDFDASGSDDGMAIEDFSFTVSYVSPSTDYFRSVQTGLWNTYSTWESSPDDIIWSPATTIPTSAANTIQIRSGDTVTINSTVTADQIVVENGGVLDYTAGTFTLEDGTGDDLDIQNGGIFILSQASTSPTFGMGSPTINVNTGGTLRISAAGLTGMGVGVNANNFLYGHQSILEYTLSGGFSSSNVTFFPNVNATTIPIFRVTASSPAILLVGAGGLNTTTFNGIFELSGTATVRWRNDANKIFRNGIRNAGNIEYDPATIGAAKFIINGETAELGGTDTLFVPPSSLEIGSASGTTLTVTSNKIVNGDISLVSTNTYVDLGTNNLIVSGNVTGGSPSSYIRTASTGALILNSVATKEFPVGDTKYNPITIHTGSNLEWTVNVNDGVTPDIPRTTNGAVLLTWNITPSVNPPPVPTDITFQYDTTLAGGQIGIDFNTPPHNDPPNFVQIWHRKQGYWLASGTTVPIDPGPSGYVTSRALNAQNFSPYGISRISLPLPIKLVAFSATKITDNIARIEWELAVCCSKDATFVLEKSTDGINFTSFSTAKGSETNRFYNVTDAQLTKGATYYRLKMIDTDGSVKYSKIVAIVNDEKGFIITSIVPNPVQNDIATITLSAAKKSTVHFYIYDIAGNTVKQWQSNIVACNNNINMHLSELAGGVYHLVAATIDSKATFRFVKQ